MFKVSLNRFENIWRLIRAYEVEHGHKYDNKKHLDEIEMSLLETMFGDAYIDEK